MPNIVKYIAKQEIVFESQDSNVDFEKIADIQKELNEKYQSQNVTINFDFEFDNFDITIIWFIQYQISIDVNELNLDICYRFSENPILIFVCQSIIEKCTFLNLKDIKPVMFFIAD